MAGAGGGDGGEGWRGTQAPCSPRSTRAHGDAWWVKAEREDVVKTEAARSKREGDLARGLAVTCSTPSRVAARSVDAQTISPSSTVLFSLQPSGPPLSRTQTTLGRWEEADGPPNDVQDRLGAFGERGMPWRGRPPPLPTVASPPPHHS